MGHAGAGAALADGPFDALWDVLAQTRAKLRAPAKRAALDGLMRYLAERAAEGRLRRLPGRRAGRGVGPDRGHVQSVVAADEGRGDAVGRAEPGADGRAGGVAPERPVAGLLVVTARRLKDWQTLAGPARGSEHAGRARDTLKANRRCPSWSRGRGSRRGGGRTCQRRP